MSSSPPRDVPLQHVPLFLSYIIQHSIQLFFINLHLLFNTFYLFCIIQVCRNVWAVLRQAAAAVPSDGESCHRRHCRWFSPSPLRLNSGRNCDCSHSSHSFACHFQSVLVPAALAIFLICSGFLASGGFGVAAVSVLSWIYRYVTGKHPPGADQLDYAKTKLGAKAREMKERVEQWAVWAA